MLSQGKNTKANWWSWIETMLRACRSSGTAPGSGSASCAVFWHTHLGDVPVWLLFMALMIVALVGPIWTKSKSLWRGQSLENKTQTSISSTATLQSRPMGWRDSPCQVSHVRAKANLAKFPPWRRGKQFGKCFKCMICVPVCLFACLYVCM